MRSGAAGGHRGYFHEGAFYGSDDEFLDIVLPFLAGGREAGEPTIITLDAKNAALVRAALGGDTDGLTFIAGQAQYANPAATIRTYREHFAALVADGAEQIRVVGDVPHPGAGAPWDWWARYEAVVNHAYDDFPLWGLCPYDTRITPDDVLADVERTHPHLAEPGDVHRRNPRFGDPRAFLGDRRRPPADPLQDAPPAVELELPTTAHARSAIAALAAGVLDEQQRDGLVLAVSESVANAYLHGRPPVTLRAWAGEGRVVVCVHDAGDGPDDPFLGLVPRHDGHGGRGLWIAHQLCTDVTLDRTDGFTIRLVAGRPHVA